MLGSQHAATTSYMSRSWINFKIPITYYLQGFLQGPIRLPPVLVCGNIHPVESVRELKLFQESMENSGKLYAYVLYFFFVLA